MPDDRFLHPRLGHSEKVCLLTELEFRVWIQYQLTADDCGVMRCSGMTIQAANDRLAKLPTKRIDKCLARLVEVGLVQTFQHQGRTYLYQHDWQDWQKVRYPRASINPQPEGEAFANCTAKTRGLFEIQAREHRQPRENVSVITPQPTGAGARETATAEANGHGERPRPAARTTSGAMAGMLPRDHLRHSVCGRICLHEKQFAEFVQKVGGSREAATERVRAWAESVLREWGEDGPKRDAVIQGDTFAWWNARYTEWQGRPNPAIEAAGKQTTRLAAAVSSIARAEAK